MDSFEVLKLDFFWSQVIGGPAHKSKGIALGDTIMAVDGQLVQADNVLTALIGRDQVGSSVELAVRNAAGEVTSGYMCTRVRARAFRNEREADCRGSLVCLPHVCLGIWACHTDVHVCIYTSVHTYIHTYWHTHTHTHTHIHNYHTVIHTCTQWCCSEQKHRA